MKLLSNILEFIGYLLSFVWHPALTEKLMFARNRLYTGYMRRSFGKFGNSVIMYPPYHFEGLESITVGHQSIIEPDVQLTAWKTDGHKPQIIIGSRCLLRRGAHITATNSIVIGDNLLTGTNVFISDNSHGNTDRQALAQPTGERKIVSKGKVIIGNNVWLGNNVCVLAGVTIGDCAVVGANSIVTHDVPAYAVVAGIPARIIKQN